MNLRSAGLAALIFAPALGLASPGLANRANISPQELAKAVDENDVKAKILPADIRIVRCTGPDEEPTELECTWRQHTDKGWITHRTWLAIDADGWHVIG